MCCCLIKTSLVLPQKIFGYLWKSLAIFRKCSENVRQCSSGLQNNFGKSLEISGKWLEIFGKLSKTLSLVCLYKQNITCLLVNTNFIFSGSTQYLTHPLHSLVEYRVEHSKIKFISISGHVISSIYVTVIRWSGVQYYSRSNRADNFKIR